MKKYIFLLLIFIGGLLAAQEITADYLVQKVDESRAPYESFRQTISIYELKNQQIQDESKLQVLYRLNSDGSSSSVAIFLAPEAQKGRKILMDGTTTWLYVPGSSRAIRISLAQRLSGGVSTGDIMALNYQKEYEAVLTGESVVNDRNTHIVELTAITRSVTYYRIILYVDKETLLPLKAEYCAKSGRILKTGYYTKYEKLDGKSINSEFILSDAFSTDTMTVIKNLGFEEETFPDHYFNAQTLKELNLE